MAEQTHSGSGDIVGRDQTKIDRQIELSDYGNYVEKQIIYGERKIPRNLTLPPFIPEIFEGRDGDLQAVHQKLFAGNTLLLLVNGEGGIGKTSLAAKYWQTYEDEYKHAAWLFAQKNLLDALLTLALPLQISFPEAMPGEDRLNLLLKAMANLDKPCLLIIDNANDIEELAKHYPALRSCPNFHVLLTSRITQFEQAQTFQIKPLQEEDALRVFKMHYPRHRQDQDGLLKSIRSAVGGNTLVMELLAKNLAAINTDEIAYSLADLLQDLQTKGLLQLSQTETVMTQEKGSHPALKKAKPTDIIAALYDEMEMIVPLTDAEQQVLSNLAVLPAENMAYSMLKTLLTPQDTKAFSKLLTGLAKRGWLEKSVQGDDSFYKISPVVQEITRHKNKDNLLSHCASLIDTLIVKLSFQPGTGHFLNASYQEAALYCRYAEAIMSCLQVTNDNLSRLCDCIGYYHITTGNLSQALKSFKEYYRLTNELYEADPDDTYFKNGLAIACCYLGNTAAAQGNLDQALSWYEQYHRLEQELHEANPADVEFKNNLAIACQKLGKTAEAQGNLDQALGWYEQNHRLAQELHKANPANVKFKNNLAIACQYLGITAAAQGNLDQALSWYEQDHRLSRELHEANPANVDFKNGLAIACLKLGETAAAQGNLDQALGWYEQYHHLEQELYEAYPANVQFKNGLAIAWIKVGWAYEKKNNETKVQECFRQSKELLEQLVTSYPLYIEFKNNLDWVKNRLGDK